jgi:hypothetical protein
MYIREYYPIVIIIVLYGIFFLLVSPLREFPLNDASLYTRAVKYFVETHQIKIPEPCSVILVFQVLWGALFCFFSGGFSFAAVKLSSLVLSILGAVTFYLILRRLKFNQFLSILGTLCLIFNPLYFCLSYTFMTDVPALALGLVAIFFYLKGLEKDDNKFLFLGAVFSTLSFLIRQNGMFIPLAFVIYMLAVYKKNIFLLRKIIFGSFLPLCVFGIYLIWFVFVHSPNWIFLAYKQFFLYPALIPLTIFWTIEYIGLFVSPLLLGCLIGLKGVLKDKRILIGGAALIIIITLRSLVSFFSPRVDLLGISNLMPYLNHIINVYGLGAPGLTGYRPILVNYVSRIFITLISFLSAATLVIIPTIQARMFFKESTRNIIYINGLLGIIFVSSLPLWNSGEQHFVALLPIGILLALDILEKIKFSKIFIFLSLILMVSYSILGTIDYLNWNEARWNAGNYLLKNGIPPEKIEAGYEWKMWFEDISAKLKQLKKENIRLEFDWAKYFDSEPEYVISFSPSLNRGDFLNPAYPISKREYRVMKKYPYYSTLIFREDFVYLLKRITN